MFYRSSKLQLGIQLRIPNIVESIVLLASLNAMSFCALLFLSGTQRILCITPEIAREQISHQGNFSIS